MESKIGQKYLTNEDYEIEVLECIDYKNCSIKFHDGLILHNKTFDNIQRGAIKNPLHKTVYGVGFFGVGVHKASVDGLNTKAYDSWRSMLSRCYNPKELDRFPTYIGCRVAEVWHNFQNFVEWFTINNKPEYMEGWHLDKDILVDGNRVYSPETCCLVPPEINSLFLTYKGKIKSVSTGVTKYGIDRFKVQLNIFGEKMYVGLFSTREEASKQSVFRREKHMRDLAEKWKGMVDERVYLKLLGFKQK